MTILYTETFYTHSILRLLSGSGQHFQQLQPQGGKGGKRQGKGKSGGERERGKEREKHKRGRGRRTLRRGGGGGR